MEQHSGLIMLFAALVLTIIAGLLNGSFATPTRYIKKWEDNSVWLVFSIFGMLIFPWATLFILIPNILTFFSALPLRALIILLIGGLCFGIGQICLSFAFRLIGISVNFVVNLAVGTTCTALIMLVVSSGLVSTWYGFLQITGIVVFVIAILICAFGGASRDKYKKANSDKIKEDHIDEKKKLKSGYYFLGVILAFIAGAGSGCQGISYVLSNPSIVKALANYNVGGWAASITAWVLMFTVAFIPYFLYFLVLNLKNKSFGAIFKIHVGRNWFLAIIIGICYWGSLVFFSGASMIIGGNLAPTIAWPLFMIFIIFVSNTWGWILGEWKNAGKTAVTSIWLSTALFVIAIAVFSGSAILKPTPQPGKTALQIQHKTPVHVHHNF